MKKIFIVMCLALFGCAATVPKEDFDALSVEKENLVKLNADLTLKLTQTKKEATETREKLDAMSFELESLKRVKDRLSDSWHEQEKAERKVFVEDIRQWSQQYSEFLKSKVGDSVKFKITALYFVEDFDICVVNLKIEAPKENVMLVAFFRKFDGKWTYINMLVNAVEKK